MQAVSHSLAHRSSSASRTRARWQPYASIQPSSMRTPSGAYLHTPASSSSTVSTPAPALHTSICESDLTKPLPPARSSSLILSQPSKDIHKHKYASGLVGEWTAPFTRSPAVSPIWETSICLDAHSFQMPPSDLCVKYGTPMISLQFS